MKHVNLFTCLNVVNTTGCARTYFITSISILWCWPMGYPTPACTFHHALAYHFQYVDGTPNDNHHLSLYLWLHYRRGTNDPESKNEQHQNQFVMKWCVVSFVVELYLGCWTFQSEHQVRELPVAAEHHLNGVNGPLDGVLPCKALFRSSGMIACNFLFQRGCKVVHSLDALRFWK